MLKEKVLICVLDKEIDRILLCLEDYIANNKNSTYEFIIKHFDYKTNLEEIEITIKKLVDIKVNKIIILLNFELYQGKDYIENNAILRNITEESLYNISKSNINTNIYLFYYTTIRTHDLYWYISNNETYFRNISSSNLKIFRDGITISYNRRLFYYNRFDTIIQIFILDKEEFWF